MTNLEFEHIYLSARDKLIAIARRYGKAAAFDLDANDVVQEALMALWELSSKGYPIRNPEALLVKITKNICVNRFRKRKLQTSSLDLIPTDIPNNEHAHELPSEAELKLLLRKILTKSELGYFTMKVEDGMTLDDMVNATGKSKSSVKMAISRGRKKIRKILTDK
ncbi:MAG: RNA polymerase sigma factor [Candidatus Cryptobacteroides sp.]